MSAAQAEQHAIEEEEVVEFKSIEELQSALSLLYAYLPTRIVSDPLSCLPLPLHRRGHQCV